MPRDQLFEQSFLDEVVQEAARRFGVQAEAYVGAVEQRLNLGASRYGDDDFRGKDILRELLEETPDVAAYAVLEAQKSLADPYEKEGHRAYHLFEAAVFAAAADWHARQARSQD